MHGTGTPRPKKKSKNCSKTRTKPQKESLVPSLKLNNAPEHPLCPNETNVNSSEAIFPNLQSFSQREKADHKVSHKGRNEDPPGLFLSRPSRSSPSVWPWSSSSSSQTPPRQPSKDHQPQPSRRYPQTGS